MSAEGRFTGAAAISQPDDWLAMLACPCCRGPLQARDAAGNYLACRGCGQLFPIRGQIPVLLRPQDLAAARLFNQSYQVLRRRSGWLPLDERQALEVPFGRPPGYPALYWPARRQSYLALVGWLRTSVPPGPDAWIADLGAGSGWLSYCLSRQGYRLAAQDLSREEDYGLRSGEVYARRSPFLRVQADLQRPPLPAGRYRVVIFNASLHYARDLPAALARASRALLPEGFVVVLDSPVARDPQPGSGTGSRQLGRDELQQALLAAGLHAEWQAQRRGPRWWLHQLKRWLAGRPVFHLPLVTAVKSERGFDALSIR